MFCYISTVPLFSTPKFTNISRKKENIGALGLNFILICSIYISGRIDITVKKGLDGQRMN